MAQHKRDALLTTVFVGSAVLAALLQGAPAWSAAGGAGGRASDGTLGNGRPGADAPTGSADPDGNLGTSGAGGGGGGGGPGFAGGAGGSGYAFPDGDGPLVASPGGAGGTAGTDGAPTGGDGGDATAFSTSGGGGGGGGASGNGVAGQAQIDNAGALTGGDGGRGGNAANSDTAQPGSYQGGGGGGAGGEGAIVTGGAGASTNRAGATLQGGAGGAGGEAHAAGGGGEGGIGLRNTGTAAFTNAGAILGGGGGAGGATTRAESGTAGAGGAGGLGVFLTVPSLFTNAADGTVAGGAGGTGGVSNFVGPSSPAMLGAAGEGGAGLSGAAGASLSNAGSITGGTGGVGAQGARGFVEITGPSGAPVATGGTGGTGGAGGRGGLGVGLTGAAGFSNTGILAGGAGGTGGFGGLPSSLFEGPPGVVDTSGGGAGGAGGTGGTGLLLRGGSALGNAGTVLGGEGGQGGEGGLRGFGDESRGGAGGRGGQGGIGAQIGTDGFTNSGLIAGGRGGAGGAGGTLGEGGTGASDFDGIAGAGGTGGTGLLLEGATRFTNDAAGRIAGGTGGTGTGAGGIGLLAPGGGTLINAGTITGGAGATGASGAAGSGGVLEAGLGGTAIVGADLAIVNSGLIAVGTGATGPAATETGRAIRFTGGLNSLTLTATSQIEGTVAAFSAADRLILGGGADGSFSAAAIGVQYQTFGVFQKVDAGTWTLTGSTPAVTPWQVLGGTLAVSADANLGAPSGGLLLNGGTLRATAPLATGRTVTLGEAGGTIQTDPGVAMAANGPLVGAGGLTKTGLGTLTLTGANSYTGATVIAAGTLALAGTGSIGTSSRIALASGATFDLAGRADNVTFIRSLGDTAVGQAGTVALGANRLILTDASGTFSGRITGEGGLTLSGGSQTLTGVSSFGGTTTVAGGTLTLGAGGVLASAVTTQAGATFANAGTVGGGLGNAGSTINDGTLTGPVSNTGSFINRGTAGELTSTAGTVTNTGTLNGAVIVTGGSLALGPGSFVNGPLTNRATVTAQGRIAGPVTNEAGASFTLTGALADLASLSNAGTVSLSGNDLGVGNLAALPVQGGVIQNAAATAATLTLGSGSTAGIVLQDGAGGGALSLAKVGAGTLTLSGTNTYTGGTALNGGVLAVSNDADLGAATGSLSFGGGALATNANFTTSRAVTLGASGGTLTPNSNASLTLTGAVSGPGGLTVGGTGRVVLTGANSYGGGTTVNAGATLQVGDGGTAGSIPGGVVANGTLTLNRSDRLDIAGIISGSGTLNQSGSGITNLTGSNGPGAAFTGTATINAGTLSINGTFGDTAGNSATVTVNAGGTLHGSGTMAGSVIVNGGTVSAGNSPGTLTVAGNYTLAPGSTSLFEFGSPGIVGGSGNDLINVGGNLGLGGTLRLVSATDATAAPVSGAYRLFNYGGTVSGAFDGITTPSAGTSALVYTDIPAQVNVLLTNGGQSVQFWDGADTTGAAAGGQGGTGTWSAGGTNWTRLPGGQINDLWRSGVGLFGGSTGTVTVAGAQAVQGLQFTVDGYRLGGTGTLTLTGDPFSTPSQSFVTVDSGVSATIATALTGQTGGIGLRKLGAGTLTLAGANTYTGATTVEAGTLALASTGALASPVTTGAGGSFANAGTVSGGLTNAGSASNDGTLAGPVTNSGSFVNRGTAGALTSTAGTVTNTGTLNGAVIITGGSLALGPGSLVDGALTNGATVTAQGRITGPVTNAAGARFTLSGALADLTGLTNAGTVSLAGNSLGVGTLTGEGGVIQNGVATAATLTLGGGGSAGTVLQDGAGGGALALAKIGAGTLTLTGASSYSGGTRVAGGTLALGGAGAAGSGAIALESGTRLAFLGSGYSVENAIRLAGPAAATIDSGPGTVALSGPITGPGALEKAGLGTLVVSGTGTYTGATAVTAGILQVDGALTGSSILTVGPGAGLTGTGRVSALTVLSGGFVAPGNAANPTGTLTAEGPVVLGAGSTLATTLSLSAASRLVTPATATIAAGGILQITPSTLAYTTPVRLPILVASAGLTGQFTTIRFTAPVRGLQPSVGYDADSAYIQFGETEPGGPTEPGRDLTSAIASAQGLARDRFGAFVTQRVLGSVLTGFNQQISCGDCVSGFGMAGSYSVGAQGRKALTEELIAIGGFAYTGYDSGRVRVSGAPIFAGLLRYDPAGLGPARPFVDVGGLFAPSQNTTYSRGYTFGTMTGQGIGRVSSVGGSVFGRVGYVARLSAQDEVAAVVEYSRGWQYAGAYTEGLLAPNPYALVSRGGTDIINIAKLGGQYTHLFGTAIETQLNLGVAHGFGLKSGLNATVADVPFTTPIKDLTWAEYGARISYRVQQDLALDAFILGTLGPQPVGDTIHGGASVRYAF
ncbi:beta strand repeat-containing protein [Methylorubrum thiocyanatum]|uniref:beta strand repeat-containing protein n=1 Tax=Methylorubrum thiocyanatum TaxID=47958 RepID=UPI0036480458